MNDALLPIKVVFSSKGDFVKPPPGGSDWEPFVKVDDALRKGFVAQIDKVMSFFKTSFQSLGDIPAVAKVSLRDEALAKTYRPTELFNNDTCPVIGGNKLGELYIGVKPEGLRRLSAKVANDTGRTTIKHLSTVQEIQPYNKDDVISNEKLTTETVSKRENRIRVRLFHHPSSEVNEVIETTFRKIARDAGVEKVTEVVYAEGMKVFCLNNVTPKRLVSLAGFVGTQAISPFPTYKIVRTAAHARGVLSASHFPAPLKGKNYGTVIQIDSGTDPTNTHLQAWVLDRYDYVPRSIQNNEHGSFVAGLIVNPRSLNNGDTRFPSVSSRIIDVVAFDKDEAIEEVDLIDVIDKALDKYPNVRTINLEMFHPQWHT